MILLHDFCPCSTESKPSWVLQQLKCQKRKRFPELQRIQVINQVFYLQTALILYIRTGRKTLLQNSLLPISQHIHTYRFPEEKVKVAALPNTE